MCRGRWRGGQAGCCGRRRVSSHRGRVLSMWQRQRQRRACCRGWVVYVYVQHRLEARRLAHGSRVPAPGRRRMCTAASCGRSDRRLVPSPPWPSTFQQQFVPACLGLAVASPSSPLRSCGSVHALANCSIGSLKLHTQPYHHAFLPCPCL
jgi:hypothetical protein